MDIKANPHPFYEGVFVTEDGRVFQECRAVLSSGGYHLVSVLPTSSTKRVRVRRHTLILEAFDGPGNGRVARHKDGNSGNDHKNNLEWGTQAENCQDTVAHGRSTKGGKNGQAKLTEEQVLEIRRRHAQKEYGHALAKEFGISQASICDITSRRTWRHI